MTWFVVKFDDENTVEAVPNTWYMKKKFQCYWPPEGTTKSAIINLIKNKHSPEANNWMLYGASILGTYGTYKVAQRKANKARVTNNLSSNTEDLKEKSNTKQKKRCKKSESEYEVSSETSEIFSSDDDIMYPEPPTESSDRMAVENNTNKNNLEYRTNTNIITSNTTNSSTSCTNNVLITPGTTSSFAFSNTALNRKLDSTCEPNSEKAFEKRVLRELHILNLKVDDISETVNALLKATADEKSSQKSFTCNNNVPDIIQLFPVNEDSLARLEDWLMNSGENKTILAKNLSRIGGCNVKEVVRRIMYHVFTNEVGMAYSWEGAKKKKTFKNLAVASSILSAVRLNKKTQEATDSEIICFIKAWLVRSKDRFNNNNKNKNITQTDERTPQTDERSPQTDKRPQPNERTEN
ncbi:unnamed protein product [Lasius platythorax]|uniref:DUF4806 domain-containing protein n=1 Tax=Lasius platythorax TaxID=488582 RepID=A0AAV2P2V1_9HYME